MDLALILKKFVYFLKEKLLYFLKRKVVLYFLKKPSLEKFIFSQMKAFLIFLEMEPCTFPPKLIIITG